MSVAKNFELIESRQLFFAHKNSLNVPVPIRRYYDLQIELVSSYLNLDGIVQRIEKTAGSKDSKPKKTNDELVADTIDVIANNLTAFTQEDDRQEAMTFLRYMMFPVMTKDSYFTVSDKTWEKIHPENFYKCIQAFGLEDVFEKAPIPNQFREKLFSSSSLPVHSSDVDRELNLQVMKFEWVKRRDSYVVDSTPHIFYSNLIGMCAVALGENRNPVPKDYNRTVVTSFLEWLKKYKNELGEKALEDARSFIIGVLYPSEVANPHIQLTEEAKRNIPPELLYEVCHEYGLQVELEAALPNWGGVHHDYYKTWQAKRESTVAISKEPVLSAAEKLDIAQKNDNQIGILLYGFMVENKAMMSKEPEKVSEAEMRKIWGTDCPKLISFALKNFNKFDEDTKATFALWLKTSVFTFSEEVKHVIRKATSAERDGVISRSRIGVIVENINPIIDLFHIAYLLDIQDGLHQAISGHLYPKPVLKAYRDWKDTAQAIAFKAACKAGQTDKAWEMLQIGESTKPEEIVPEKVRKSSH